MKKRKVISILCACMIYILTFSGTCLAEEQTTNVSYTPSYNSIAPTQIKIVISSIMSEFGTIYDANNNIVSDAAIYEIKHEDIMAFNIQPKIGYDVDKIIYDGKDITSNMKAMRSIQKKYIIEIIGLGYDTDFEVIYKKMDGGIIEDPNQPDDPSNPDSSDNSNSMNKSPNTGDETNLYRYMTMAGISMVVIIATLLYKKKKKDEEI